MQFAASGNWKMRRSQIFTFTGTVKLTEVSSDLFESSSKYEYYSF